MEGREQDSGETEKERVCVCVREAACNGKRRDSIGHKMSR